jgi:NADH-quinone oxidoreductase subunit G
MSIEKTTQENMVNLIIDGKDVRVPKGTTVYHAAKQLGLDIPIFCYLDRMPPFGACRMCLVEVEKMSKLQTACTLEVAEGMVVKTQSALAVDGRKEIIEFLLLNHPLDCPICDRGGECPLQENALNHGPGESRFYEEKRRFKKPLPLGPVLMLDRERCIICARCTRFGDILAGDHALEFMERGYKTEVGTPHGGPAESKFIGNTIMICPVGALTSQVYRFRARPWDNEPTESTCTLCPVGCSMILDSRDGQIMRTRSLENKDVNDIWLCDKGWFGYEFTYHPDRLKNPLVRRNGKLEPATWEEAFSLIAKKIQEAKPQGKLAAFGGNPLTFEENYLFQKLMREVAGVNHMDHRIGMPIISPDEEGLAPGMEMSIGECEDLSFAVLFGLDITEEFPVIWLRLRQAINKGATVIFLGHFAPEIAPYLSKVVLHAPGKEIEMLRQHLPDILSLAKEGKKGALFVGRQYLANPQRRAILSELLKVRQTTSNVTLNIMEGTGDSLGARLAGMRPDFGPFEKQLNKPGLNALQVLEEAAHNGWDFLYVAGSNPAAQFPTKFWGQARAKLKFMVVQDLFLTETAQQADVVLPTLSFIEKGGSFINIEGRVQALMPGKEVPATIYGDGEAFMEIAKYLNVDLDLDDNFEEKLDLKKVPFSRPDKIDLRDEPVKPAINAESDQKLLATFARILFDHGVRMQHDPHLVWLAKEPRLRLHPQEGISRGIKDDDTVRLSANGNSFVAKVKFDEQVAAHTIVLPLGFEKEVSVHELGTNLMNGLAVEIKLETEVKSREWGVK